MLDPRMQRLIRPYMHYYNIGVYGPDILFYYRCFSKNAVNQCGVRIHDEPMRFFLEHAFRIFPYQRHKRAAFAYLAGFMTHFILDSTCHPFLEDYIHANGVAHTKIEGEFDRMLLVEDGKDPVRQDLVPHIHPTEENARVISEFFPGVSAEQLRPALR